MILFVGGFFLCNRICMGTVQLGQHYGINNALGRKPNLQESFNLLEKAINSGVNFFDTASAYGDAEIILGKFGINRFPVKIISKLRPKLLSSLLYSLFPNSITP